MDSDPIVSIKRKEIENLCNLFKQNAYSVCYETPEVSLHLGVILLSTVDFIVYKTFHIVCFHVFNAMRIN